MAFNYAYAEIIQSICTFLYIDFLEYTEAFKILQSMTELCLFVCFSSFLSAEFGVELPP